jgi:ABC-2 type transport system permease protein
MTALVRAELLRIRSTRATWGLIAVALVLTLAWTGMILGDVGGVGGYPRGSIKLREALLGAAGVGALPVLLLGVLAITGEFHHRTATSTFLTTPRRWRVVAAKAAACTLISVPVAVVLMIAPLTTGFLAGAIDVTPDAVLAKQAARALLGFACWALLGVGVGAAIRNQTVATAIPLLWFGVVEQMLPSYGLSWLMPWLPGGVNAALGGARFPGVLPLWGAVLVFLAYALALLGPGARAIAVRDIT